MANGSGTKLDTLFWELEVRTARIEAAEAEALAAGKKIGAQIDKGVQEASTGQQGASKWVDSLINDFRERREDIKREAVAGLITPEEAAAAGRQAAAQFSKELRGGLHALREQGVIQTSDFTPQLLKGADALRLSRQEAERLATQVNTTASVYDKLSRSVYASAYAMDAARPKATSALYDNLSRSIYQQAYAMDAARGSTEKAGVGVGNLRGALTQLAATSLGTNASASRLVSTLSTMGLGATLTVGLTAGIAAIAFFFDKVTSSAREAKKKVDDLIDSLIRAREQGRPQTTIAQESLDAASDAQRQAQTRVDRLSRLQQVVGDERGEDEGARAAIRLIGSRRLAEAQADLAEKTKAMGAAQIALNSARREEESSHDARLGHLVAEGAARKDQAVLAKQQAEEARAALKLLNEESVRGEARRTQVRQGSPDAKDPVLDEQTRLQARIRSLTEIERVNERAARSAETAAEKERRHDESVQGLIDRLTTLKASLTSIAEDDSAAKLQEIDSLIAKARPDADQLAKLTALRTAIATLFDEKNAAKAEELSRSLREIVVASTVTAVDDLTFALEQFDKKIEDVRKTGAPVDEKMVAQVRAAKVATIELTKETEALQNALVDIEQKRNRSQNDIGAVRELNTLKDALETELKRAKTADDRRRILREIEDIERRIKGIVDSQPKPLEEVESKTAKIASNIADIANAAFGLASAFLGVDHVLTKILGSIGQIAGGIESISNAKNLLQALPGIGQVIGGGLALGNALFGESTEEKARRERIKENTEALRKLSQDIGDLGRSITGTQFNAVGSALTNPNLGTAQNTDQLSRILGRNLSELGLSFQDLAAFASALGITIDTTRIQFEDVKAILDAMNMEELGQFPDTFAGQMAKLNAEIDLFDISDPIAQFRALRKALESIDGGGKAGVLGQLVDTFDLSNPEGIAAAIAKLQELFGQITSGAIDAAQFGGLSGQDLIDTILKMVDLLRGQQSAAGSGGFNVDRTITEVTGSRMAALLSTGNVFAEMTAANTEAIARLLNGGVPTSLISAPSISPSASSSVIGGVTFGDISITVQVQAGDVADPENFGRKVARGFVQQISEGQANQLSWKKRAIGNVTRGSVS